MLPFGHPYVQNSIQGRGSVVLWKRVKFPKLDYWDKLLNLSVLQFSHLQNGKV